MTENGRFTGEGRWLIRDALGRSVTQVDPCALYRLGRHDVIPPEQLRRIAHEIGPGPPGRPTRMFRLWLALAAMHFLLRFIYSLIVGSERDVRHRADAIRRGLATVEHLWRAGRRAHFERVRLTMLRHLRCPHCGSDLRASRSASENRAAFCSACGCAWRIDEGVSADRS